MKKFRVKVTYGSREPYRIEKVRYHYFDDKKKLAKRLYQLYTKRKEIGILRIEVSEKLPYGRGYRAPFAVYPHGWSLMWRFYAIIANELNINPLKGENRTNIHYYIAANPWIPLEKRKELSGEAWNEW